MDLTLREIRRRIIIAVASDDELMETLVLKGGNALQVVHGIGDRASVDIDYSLAADFSNVEEASERLKVALERTFREVGIRAFDYSFEPRPRVARDPRWGGYEVQFKLIDEESLKALDDDLSEAQRRSRPADDFQRRNFKIQISKYEHTQGSEEVDVDDYVVRVYTPPMIAIEKIRALCQQHPDYTQRGYSSPRARDLYDIRVILEQTHADLTAPENLEMLKAMFQAKEVNSDLLLQLPDQRELHEEEWEAVKLSVRGLLEDFDYYFDFVISLASEIKAAWDEQAPV